MHERSMVRLQTGAPGVGCARARLSRIFHELEMSMNWLKHGFVLTALTFCAILMGSSPSAALCVQNPMSGTWVSVNSATRGLTRADIQVGCCDQVSNGVPVCSTACTSSAGVIRLIAI